MNTRELMDQTLLVAIHKKCMECSCDSRKEVQRCKFTGCALYPYRMGNARGGRQERPKELKGQISIFEVLKA